MTWSQTRDNFGKTIKIVDQWECSVERWLSGDQYKNKQLPAAASKMNIDQNFK